MKCIIIDDDALTRILIEKYSKEAGLELIGSFENALDALKSNIIDECELMFVDIEMPEINGLDFIRSLPKTPLVIVVSAKSDYAISSLDLNAIDYLLKPIEYTRFLKAINKAREFHKGHLSKDYIFLKDIKNCYIKFVFDEIIWVEAMENYVVINTENDSVTLHYTMTKIEEKLPVNDFMRIHRSFIVNVNKIVSFDDDYVYVMHQNKRKALSLARARKDDLIKRLNIIQK